MGDRSPYTRFTKKCINQNPDSLNQYFTELASKLINKENVAFDQTKLLTVFPKQEPDGAFFIKHTLFTEVNKFISELRNDCSNGYDDMTVTFIKPVAKGITFLIVNIINSSIYKEYFVILGWWREYVLSLKSTIQ